MAKKAGERLEEILAELGNIGAVLPGSISERRTRCQRPGCHCRAEPAVLHGPYRTWTWRPGGLAVTKTLTNDGGAARSLLSGSPPLAPARERVSNRSLWS